MLLMAHLDGYHELSNVNLISYVMIKLSRCGRLYTKAIEIWKMKNAADKKIWAKSPKHLIAEYENY